MKCKLEDIVDVTMGQSPKSEYYNTEGKGYPFLQGNRTFGFKYPTFDTYTTVMTKPAKAGDVIMSVRAPVGDLNITPVDMCLGRGVCSLRMKNGNQDFLFYMMKYYIPHLLKKESGTVFGSVNRNDINGLEVNIPEDAQVQKEIARYLEMIDDKIELNNAINNNLEQQAAALFQAWFVNFEPFGGSMPENWTVGNLGQIAELKTRSFSPAKNPDTMLEHYSIPSYDEKHFPVFEVASGVKSNKYILTPSSVMISKLNPDTKRIWRPLCLTSHAVCSTEFMVYEAINPKHRDFVYSIIDDPMFSAFLCAHTTGSTNSRQRATPSVTLTYPVPIPSNDVIDKFCATVSPMYDLIGANTLENQKLAKTRDSLLPKLMSGELDVSGIES
uniref:restriction endonuclease subunit S n=1 Tax=Eubacterium sp. TaxID=142586 RepID=UPI004024C2FC